MPNERVERTVHQALDDLVIESARHHGKPSLVARRRAGKLSHQIVLE